MVLTTAGLESPIPDHNPKPENRDFAATEAAIGECAKFWAMLDQHLAERPYILGDHPTMADIPLGSAAYRWHSMRFERPDYPNLKAWWARLVGRSAYQTHVMLPLT